MTKKRGGSVQTIERKPKKSVAKKIVAPSEARMTLRLTKVLNETLRRAALYRGDISKTIAQALNSVDLIEVKAIDLEADGELAGATTIVIDSDLFQRLKQVSKERGSSMNLLINSALAHKFGFGAKGR